MLWWNGTNSVQHLHISVQGTICAEVALNYNTKEKVLVNKSSSALECKQDFYTLFSVEDQVDAEPEVGFGGDKRHSSHAPVGFPFTLMHSLAISLLAGRFQSLILREGDSG